MKRLKYRIANLFGYELMKPRRAQLTLEGHLAAVFRSRRIECVVDVGANEGQYARLVRRAGYRGRIVSFEPLPEAFATLQRLAAADADWVVHRLALGREDGTRVLHRTRSTDLASFHAPARLCAERFGAGAEVIGDELVSVRRLDGLAGELLGHVGSGRLFLKMDTQGWDLEVFAGAEGLLDRVEGLQSELSVTPLYEGMPGYLEAIAEYRRHGFEISGFYPVWRDTGSLVLGEADCVLLRRASRG